MQIRTPFTVFRKNGSALSLICLKNCKGAHSSSISVVRAFFMKKDIPPFYGALFYCRKNSLVDFVPIGTVFLKGVFIK